MGRMVGAAARRLRAAALVVLGSTGMVLLTSLLAATGAPSSLVSGLALTVALAVVVATVAAVLGRSRPPLGALSPPTGPLRDAEASAAAGAGRVTDAPRHPLRPRAPGLV